ncbi:MAG: hypothetical protein IPM58_08025 [Nitrospira sp.]|nr:hypothetical protein [Nitrospira sp.]
MRTRVSARSLTAGLTLRRTLAPPQQLRQSRRFTKGRDVGEDVTYLFSGIAVHKLYATASLREVS